MNSGITILKTHEVIGAYADGWYAKFANDVLAKAVHHSKLKLIVVGAPMQTSDSLPLADTALRVLRLILDQLIAARKLEIETMEIYQQYDDGVLHVFVTIQT